MPKKKLLKNRHNVDRLADIRELIKKLQDEEHSLRDEIMLTQDYVGDDYMVVPKHNTRKTLDRTLLEAKFGKAEVDACCKVSEYDTLNMFKKADVDKSFFK